ncbi:MAG: hypothetical protein ACYC1L_03905 [Alphaproteobacteria bacterium]
MRNETEAYRREGDVVLVELRLSNLRQLFNSLDPAPFHEKDLDPDAEAYIVESVREFPLDQKMKLVVHLPRAELPACVDLAASIHHHFTLRRDEWRRELSHQLHQGRVTLGIAVVFLFACLFLRQLIRSLGDGALLDVLGEGLLITGWVAMWRPIDILLYGWWPIRTRCRIAEKLIAMPVEPRPRDD